MALTRRFWHAIEAIHNIVYVAPGMPERFEALGLRGFWMSYIASRAAALGTPTPEVVVATFHGFAPERIARALPDAWRLAAREDILHTRQEIARDVLAPCWEGLELEDTAHQLHAMLEGADWAGKPLAAAHASLPAPRDPVARLWHAATAWREYRGDCHVAILTAAGLDGAGANLLAQAAGLVPEDQQVKRGWSDQAWSTARSRLRQREWVDDDGLLTAVGRGAREQLESATDRVCAAGLDLRATARGVALEQPLLDLALRLQDHPGFADVNPTGVPRPQA